MWLIIILFFGIESNAQLMPLDKQKHFAVGALIGGVTTLDRKSKHPIWNAILVSSFCGVGKELADASLHTGTPEIKDALFTTLGGAVGGAIVYGVSKSISKNRKRRKS